MKNVICLLLFCLLLGFYSCRRSSYPQSLFGVDSLISANPDSAVSLLKSIENEMVSQSEEVWMYYQLLCIKAADKAYIPLVSDSLIFKVLHYYLEKKDNHYLPEAYFYAGRVCKEQGDAPQALSYFYKALDTLKEAPLSSFNGLICSQIGYICSYQCVYDEAISMFRQAYQVSFLNEDSVSMVYDLRDIASVYKNINMPDSALIYYQKAYDMAYALRNQSMLYMIKGQLASLYKQIKKYDLAKNNLQEALNYADKADESAIYSIASDLYRQTGNKDSAIYYYNEILDCGTIYAKADAYWHLAKYTLEENRPWMAMEYLEHYIESIDSVWGLTDAETVRKMQSLYNYTLRENENNQLKVENARKRIYLTGSMLIILFIVFCFFFYYMYSKTKQLKLRMQLVELKQIEEESYQKSRSFVEANKKELKMLEQQFRIIGQNETLMQAKLYYTGRKAELEIKMRENRWKQLLDTDIYQYFERLCNTEASFQILSKEWDSLQGAVNEAYPGFTGTLLRIHKLSKHELRVCLLIKIGILPKDIAKLTNHSKESITSVRRRLYEKFFGKKGTPLQWDEFIRAL